MVLLSVIAISNAVLWTLDDRIVIGFWKANPNLTALTMFDHCGFYA